jgi:hypothetical protein
MLPTPIDERLPRLSAHYAWRINAAVAAGRMDLVRDLANDYQDEALDLMLALGSGTPSQPKYDAAEILEFGGGRQQRRRAGRPGTWRFRFWRYNRS